MDGQGRRVAILAFGVASCLFVSLPVPRCSEQPIFTCNAHVFHIDPKTKRTWITASTKAVSVSFFYDSSRSLFRIISVEGSKAVINSTITPNMTFTQTSQKFGQWSDVRANTVYGLGFSSEVELQIFVEKFQEVKEATKKAMKAIAGASPGANATGGAANAADSNNSFMNSSATVPPPTASTPLASANTSPISGRNSLLAPVDMSHESLAAMDQPSGTGAPMALPSINSQDATSPAHKQKGSGGGGAVSDRAGVPAAAVAVTGGVPALPSDATGQQLKYENERLKLALAQSSANAKNWEIELQTLRNNNLRLTSALQESTANVDEWQRQLQTYKDENVKLKAQIQDLLDGNGGAGEKQQQQLEVTSSLRKEISLLQERIESLEGELKAQEVELKSATNKSLRDRAADPSMKQMNSLVAQFAKHLSEMSSMQKEMEKIMISSKST